LVPPAAVCEGQLPVLWDGIRISRQPLSAWLPIQPKLDCCLAPYRTVLCCAVCDANVCPVLCGVLCCCRFVVCSQVSQLLLLDNQDQGKDIKMFINSPGQ
jgi:hypothetical protein